jgi:hypothetical protein
MSKKEKGTRGKHTQTRVKRSEHEPRIRNIQPKRFDVA